MQGTQPAINVTLRATALGTLRAGTDLHVGAAYGLLVYLFPVLRAFFTQL